ncbi:MAG: sortase [Anaerolineales bacterium]
MITPKLCFRFLFRFVLVALIASMLGVFPAKANNASAALPFSQNWSSTGSITVNDDWSGVQSIIGYRGDDITTLVGINPQTLLAGDDAAPVVDVNANQSNPNTNTTGGVTEFDGIANPVIALQGSATTDAPYIKIFLNTTGVNNVRVSYNVRDIDGSTDNAIQQVALQYRIGSSGNFTNIAAGYIADATTGPSLATLVTNVNTILPAAVNNQSVVELRIMTTNATGNDEWVGIDDISITANYAPTGFALAPNSILENQSAGTLVGTLSASDANVGDTHTFTLVNSAACAGNGVDNAKFSILGNSLSTTTSFDYETASSYKICVTVTDNNGLSFTGEHTVIITDIPDETPPSVALEQSVGQLDPTNVSPINFTVVFSESISGFDGSDIDLSPSTAGGLLTATVIDTTPAHTTFSVSVTGMTSGGDVIASVRAGAAVDGIGNASLISTSIDNKVVFSTDTTPPLVTIEQATSQPDPTNISPINFTVLFSEPITGFDASDIVLSGTAGAITANIAQIAPNDETTFNVAVSGMSTSGTVIAEVKAGAVVDALSNTNAISLSTDNIVLYSTDIVAPHVLFSANTTPADNSILLASPQIQIEFDEDVKSNGSAGAVNNVANFLLVEAGANTLFDTASCASSVAVDDVKITVDSITYNNSGGAGPYLAALTINSGKPLAPGFYRLFICGTTSIEDLLGNKLNNGLSDTLLSFTISQVANAPLGKSDLKLPATGFPVGRITRLPSQPEDKVYASFSDLWLEIPKLAVSTPIVGVPLSPDGWDVTWLGSDAGWLNETAFPTWAGNSVITGHVWDAFNQPGIFYNLKKLEYGDQIKVHAFGKVYIYEVRQTKRIAPDNFSAALKHEDKAWLTLITCEDYKLLFQTYSYRRMVRAVLLRVDPEQ